MNLPFGFWSENIRYHETAVSLLAKKRFRSTVPAVFATNLRVFRNAGRIASFYRNNFGGSKKFSFEEKIPEHQQLFAG